MKVWWLLLCFSLVLATSARAQQAASTAEQIVSEARARIATADAFACDLQDKACLNTELVKRFENDQWIRTHFVEVCTEADISACPLIPVWRELDEGNLRRVDAVLTAHGWPTGEGWSQDAERAVWFVVQHTPDGSPKDWKPIVLPAVRKAVAAGRLTGWHYAAMFDRYEEEQGRLQLYGTQFVCPDGLGKPCHLDALADPRNVNALRAELCMEPLSGEEIAGARDDE